SPSNSITSGSPPVLSISWIDHTFSVLASSFSWTLIQLKSLLRCILSSKRDFNVSINSSCCSLVNSFCLFFVMFISTLFYLPIIANYSIYPYWFKISHFHGQCTRPHISLFSLSANKIASIITDLRRFVYDFILKFSNVVRKFIEIFRNNIFFKRSGPTILLDSTVFKLQDHQPAKTVLIGTRILCRIIFFPFLNMICLQNFQ